MLLKFQTDICLLGGFPQVDPKFTCFTSTKVRILTPMRLSGDALLDLLVQKYKY